MSHGFPWALRFLPSGPHCFRCGKKRDSERAPSAPHRRWLCADCDHRDETAELERRGLVRGETSFPGMETP